AQRVRREGRTSAGPGWTPLRRRQIDDTCRCRATAGPGRRRAGPGPGPGARRPRAVSSTLRVSRSRHTGCLCTSCARGRGSVSLLARAIGATPWQPSRNRRSRMTKECLTWRRALFCGAGLAASLATAPALAQPAPPPATATRPAPYALPWLLRPAVPGSVVRLDETVAFYEDPASGTSGSSYLT